MGSLLTTLTERQTSHGEFRDNSEISQRIKQVIRSGVNYSKLRPYQQEALEMIAHKIGRILSGDHMFQDHWTDINGYAKLAEDRVKADLVIREKLLQTSYAIGTGDDGL